MKDPAGADPVNVIKEDEKEQTAQTPDTVTGKNGKKSNLKSSMKSANKGEDLSKTPPGRRESSVMKRQVTIQNNQNQKESQGDGDNPQ